MAVDRGYGTGSVKPTSARSGSASLRKKGVKAAARKYTKVTTSKAKSVAGSSEYVQRENAARTQLGTAGVAARARQLPTAARASLREMTGIDVSRKGVSVDPVSLAMALPVGKVIKAARVLRAAGQAGKAEAVMSRAAAKLKGQRIGREFSYFDEPVEIARETRARSESVFPRGTDLAKRALKAGSELRTSIKGSLNYQFPFNRVINESERIERKYGLTQRTAEEGLRQAAKRVKPRKTGGR